jgi:hypothetical protein
MKMDYLNFGLIADSKYIDSTNVDFWAAIDECDYISHDKFNEMVMDYIILKYGASVTICGTEISMRDIIDKFNLEEDVVNEFLACNFNITKIEGLFYFVDEIESNLRGSSDMTGYSTAGGEYAIFDR